MRFYNTFRTFFKEAQWSLRFHIFITLRCCRIGAHGMKLNNDYSQGDNYKLGAILFARFGTFYYPRTKTQYPGSLAYGAHLEVCFQCTQFSEILALVNCTGTGYNPPLYYCRHTVSVCVIWLPMRADWSSWWNIESLVKIFPLEKEKSFIFHPLNVWLSMSAGTRSANPCGRCWYIHLQANSHTSSL